MKQRVADFIADYLAENGVTQIFSVVGGMAMHLNNAFGTNEKLNVVYNHHEQACAIAAESYSRINNKIAAVCVTSGPGGTNAVTGVLCAYLDNLPMIVFSGQVRHDITVESTGLNLRQFGEQEFQIVKSVSPMTKYAVMINDAKSIKYHIGKALYLANTGRRGPCWIDIPLDIQGQIIETNDLPEYIPPKELSVSENVINKIIEEIRSSERPVLIAGSGMRTSGALDKFYELVDKWNLPVICPTSISDILPNDDKNYYGMFGSFGGRTGNFIVQNADLILSFGCRFSFKQIGFNFEKFSPHSKKIVIDIDSEELRKPTIYIDVPICADIYDVVSSLNEKNIDVNLNNKKLWIDYCNFLKQKFNTQSDCTTSCISAYTVADLHYKNVDKNAITVVGNNCGAIAFLQQGIRVKGQRVFGNVNCGPMGYDIPAAIGASFAAKDTVYCMTGDGSFQMNIQELQTIVHHKLPVKIVVFNNNSYQAIVQTQKNFFNSVYCGCTVESGISFPSFEKIAYAYGIPFRSIDKSSDILEALKWLYGVDGFALLELIQSEPDPIRPKLSSKKLEDGTMVSLPIDDLYPFLSDDEYQQCQFLNFANRRLER